MIFVVGDHGGTRLPPRVRSPGRALQHRRWLLVWIILVFVVTGGDHGDHYFLPQGLVDAWDLPGVVSGIRGIMLTQKNPILSLQSLED